MKTVFWLYIGGTLADLCKFRNGDEESHADIGQLTKMAIFTNSRWGTDEGHFENSFIFISQSELPDFAQIWYADENFHSKDGYLTKIEIFQIQDGGRTPY